jgi:hypothetical protein
MSQMPGTSAKNRNGSPAEAQPAAKPDVPCPARPDDELEILIRARYPIIYVVSWEEERVAEQLNQIAALRGKKFYVWTLTQGIIKYGSETQRAKSNSGNTTDPLSALDAVLAHVEPAIYLFKDFHPFTEENRANLAVIRRLKDVAYHLRDSYKTIVIVAPMLRLAPELAKDVTLVELRPPDVPDFNRLLDRIVEESPRSASRSMARRAKSCSTPPAA